MIEPLHAAVPVSTPLAPPGGADSAPQQRQNVASTDADADPWPFMPSAAEIRAQIGEAVKAEVAALKEKPC